jgi:DNA-binding NtrC family response regulator
VVNQISIIERRREITPEILQQYLPHNEQHTGLVAISTSQSDNYQDTTNIAVLKQIVLSLNNDLIAMKQQVEELKAQVNAGTGTAIYLEQGEQIKEANTASNEKRVKTVIEDIISDSEIEEVDPIQDSSTTIHKLADRDRDKKAIRDALEATGGNRKAAAALLGVSERTLYRKLKEE